MSFHSHQSINFTAALFLDEQTISPLFVIKYLYFLLSPRQRVVSARKEKNLRGGTTLESVCAHTAFNSLINCISNHSSDRIQFITMGAPGLAILV